MTSVFDETLYRVVATMKRAAAALRDAEPDLRAVLELARALRERIDWGFVRASSSSSPFAHAFFTVVEGLGIIERPEHLAAVAEH